MKRTIFAAATAALFLSAGVAIGQTQNQPGATPPAGMDRTETGQGATPPTPGTPPSETAAPGDATREPAPTGMERTELEEQGTAGEQATGTNRGEMAGQGERVARMPDTAGPLPLIGLLGFAALAGGVALRRR